MQENKSISEYVPYMENNKNIREPWVFNQTKTVDLTSTQNVSISVKSNFKLLNLKWSFEMKL